MDNPYEMTAGMLVSGQGRLRALTAPRRVGKSPLLAAPYGGPASKRAKVNAARRQNLAMLRKRHG